jgi:uncharacterized membrane protein YfcA
MVVTGSELLGFLLLGLAAGTLGALVGIGGGVIVVPALILVFGFEAHIAIATSLLAIVGTSVTAGAQPSPANLRIGTSLELTSILGGMAGALIATAIAPQLLSILLGILLAATAALLIRRGEGHGVGHPQTDAEAAKETRRPGRLGGTYVDARTGTQQDYEARRVPTGSAIAFGAGAISGVLGVGGGFLKVPTLNVVMGLPLKVSAATSNFMVGITALGSLAIYVARGYLYPYAAAPVVLGGMVGAIAGMHMQRRSSPTLLRTVLAVVLMFVSAQLLLTGVHAS